MPYFSFTHAFMLHRPQFLLFNLGPSLTPPFFPFQAPPHFPSPLPFFSSPTELPSFIHSLTPLVSLRQEAQVSLKRTSPGRVCCHGDGVNGLEGGCGKQNHSTGLI